MAELYIDKCTPLPHYLPPYQAAGNATYYTYTVPTSSINFRQQMQPCSLDAGEVLSKTWRSGKVQQREISLTRRHIDRHTEMGGGGMWDSLKPINQNEHITTQNADQKLKIFNLSAFKPISCRATAAKLNHHHCGEGVVYIYKDICVCLRGLLWGLKYI